MKWVFIDKLKGAGGILSKRAKEQFFRKELKENELKEVFSIWANGHIFRRAQKTYSK